MKVDELAMILLCLVSCVCAVWQQRMCEDNYNGISCLESYLCLEEFLRCDCIPQQYASQNFEELCWTSLAVGVGAPTCCLSVEKRKHTLSKRMLQNSNNDIGDISTIARHKQNYSYRNNAVLNIDMKEGIKQHDKHTNTVIDLRNKHNSLTSRLGLNNLENVYTNYVHDPVNGKLANKIRNNSRQNLVIDIITALVQSWKKAYNEPNRGETNRIPNHTSACDDSNVDNKDVKLNDVKTADEDQINAAKTQVHKEFNIVSGRYEDDYNEVSFDEGIGDVVPDLIQISREKGEGGDTLSSYSKIKTVHSRENYDSMQSRILNVLNNLYNR